MTRHLGSINLLVGNPILQSLLFRSLELLLCSKLIIDYDGCRGQTAADSVTIHTPGLRTDLGVTCKNDPTVLPHFWLRRKGASHSSLVGKQKFWQIHSALTVIASPLVKSVSLALAVVISFPKRSLLEESGSAVYWWQPPKNFAITKEFQAT